MVSQNEISPEGAPVSIYKEHDVPNKKVHCPSNVILYSFSLSGEFERPLYICLNRQTGEVCGATFDQNGNPFNQ